MPPGPGTITIAATDGLGERQLDDSLSSSFSMKTIAIEGSAIDMDNIVRGMESGDIDAALMMMDDTRVHEHEWDINWNWNTKCWKLLGLLPDDVLSKFAFICEGKHPAKPPEGTTVTVTSSGLLTLPATDTGDDTRKLLQQTIGVGRRLQSLNGWSAGAVAAFEQTILQEAQNNLVLPTTAVNVTITSITQDASGNQDISYDLTLEVSCGTCSPAEAAQAESEALAAVASSLSTSILSGEFATAFQTNLSNSGTINCGDPPFCDDLVSSAANGVLAVSSSVSNDLPNSFTR